MKILVTAGPVYGLLDDNKLVSNRVRGIWATLFASYLVRTKGWEVSLLIPDMLEREVHSKLVRDGGLSEKMEIITHRGFYNYQDKVLWQLGRGCTGAVLAAAVVNWIPEKPFEGKMPTKGVGDRMNIPFILAPRVIDAVKKVYPYTTLIGCKMTIGATHDHLIDEAYRTLLGARCNAVVANDMKTGLGLHQKFVVHPDRVVKEFELIGGRSYQDASERLAAIKALAIEQDRAIPIDGAPRFFEHLAGILADEHYSTTTVASMGSLKTEALRTFDRFVDKYRLRFTKRLPDGDFVFGALAVPYNGPFARQEVEQWNEALVSPREKGAMFDSRSAVVVTRVDTTTRRVETTGGKATLNAPLLVRHLRAYPEAHGVLHLHEQLPNVPTAPYYPPGTARDLHRPIPGPVYNIDGHGFIACLDRNGEIW